MKIEVTSSDIARGEPCVPRGCPIALALKRAMPGRSVSVSPHVAFLDQPDLPIPIDEIPLPPEVTKFVLDFDFRRPVEPFTFTLQIPCK